MQAFARSAHVFPPFLSPPPKHTEEGVGQEETHLFLILKAMFIRRLLYVRVFNPALFNLCATCMQYPRRPEEGEGSPEAGTKEGSKPPCESWESHPGPLEEQPVHS